MSQINQKNNKTLFLLGITSNWSFAVATILLGLKKYRKKPYDVCILHEGLSEKQMLLLSKIIPCKFEYFNIDLPLSDKFKRVSSMSFSRFEAFKFIKYYDYVIWLDADALIVKNLDKIEETCIGDMAMFLHKNTPIRVSFSKNVEEFNMTKKCFNSGIFILHNTIKNPDDIYHWLFEATYKYIDYISSDQAIINMMLQVFDIKVTKISIKYNCHPEKFYLKPRILHPWGDRKFWNYYSNNKWNEYYKIWVSMGGEPNPKYEEFRLKQTFFTKLKRKIKSILSILHNLLYIYKIK